MGSEWSRTTVGEFLDLNGGSIKTGPFGTKLKASEYSPVGVPVISVGEVQLGRLVLHERTPKVSPETTARMPEYLLLEGDIVFGRKGSVERSARVNAKQNGWFLGSDGIRLRLTSSCDTRFVAYQLLTEAHKKWMIQHAAGTTMASLNEKIVKRISLVMPPLEEQKAIALFLDSLDNKIQLNRETNQTLEAMAQALFKSWFVDFDPVFDNAIAHNLAHNNAPLHNIPEPLLPHAQRRLNVHNVGRGLARQTASQEFHHLFPQAFEQSDEPSVGIQGWVPKGWGVEKIGDVIENVGGGTPKTKEDDYWINGTHAFCTPKDMSSLSTKVLLKTERHLTDLGVSKVSSGVLDVGTVLMSSRAPIGYLAIAKTPTTVNQGIIAMKPNGKYSSEYILCWAEINQEEVVARANGSIFLEISKKNFREIPFVEPTDECTKQFGILAKEYFDRIEILSKENKQLESLRDTLLPKLISGELRIPDAEQATEALAK
jgi:type I restriction enzyme S subunit